MSWLDKTGLRLEHQTCEAFRRESLKTVLGSYVNSREIDAQVSEEFETKRGRGSLKVLCECKYSKEQPWVLLHGGDQTAHEPNFWSGTPASQLVTLNRDKILAAERDLRRSDRQNLTITPLAYNLMEALRKEKPNTDRAYDALQKISTLSWDLAETEATQTPLTIVTPALIVEGPLYAATFDVNRGAFDVKPTSFGHLLWLGCRGGTLVNVVQADSLREYAQRISGCFNAYKYILNQAFG